MKAAPFELARPSSIDEAIGCLVEPATRPR